MGASGLVKHFFREYGFALVFFVYWAWYAPMLYYMSNYSVENTLEFEKYINLSYGFLGTSIIALYYFYADDINMNFFVSCALSFITRMIGLYLKYDILASARLFVGICGFAIFAHCIIRLIFNSKRGIYF